VPGGLCAVLLAAGTGTRLRPLTLHRPKALCPVGTGTLLDRAFDAAARLGLSGPDAVAVNAWHLADQIVTAAAGRAHVSMESGPAPLGSSGGLAALRDWIDGRDTVVVNADAYLAGGSLDGLADGWDGTGVRMLGVPAGDRPAEFGAYRFAGLSVLPWRYLEKLGPGPGDLVLDVWRPAEAIGELTVVEYGGVYLESGTPADYLDANRQERERHRGRGFARVSVTGTVRDCLVGPGATVSGDASGSVIGADAVVAGTVDDCVIWPGAMVGPGEHLRRAVRYGVAAADTVLI